MHQVLCQTHSLTVAPQVLDRIVGCEARPSGSAFETVEYERGRGTRQADHTIRTWMLSIVRDGGIARFDDLHIDRIDASWKARQRWIEGALEAYRIALGVRADLGLQLSVAITFSLESAEHRRGIDFTTPAELEERFDRTPPPLYLFELGRESLGRQHAARRNSRTTCRMYVRRG